MGMFDSLFQNEKFQQFAFGQLRNIIKDQGYEMMVLRINPETDALQIDMFKPGEATLTVNVPIEKVAGVEANLITEKTETNAENRDSSA